MDLSDELKKLITEVGSILVFHASEANGYSEELNKLSKDLDKLYARLGKAFLWWGITAKEINVSDLGPHISQALQETKDCLSKKLEELEKIQWVKEQLESRFVNLFEDGE